LTDFQIFSKMCNKAVTYYHTLTASLHYLVKYKFSKIAIITATLYTARRLAGVHLLSQFTSHVSRMFLVSQFILDRSKFCLSRTFERSFERVRLHRFVIYLLQMI